VKSRRDAGLTALFLGFFAAAWFDWAQAESTRTWLLVGSIVSLVIAALGAVVGFRRPGAESALHDRAKYRRYGIIVGIEFALAGIGAAISGSPARPRTSRSGSAWWWASTSSHSLRFSIIQDYARSGRQ
jgi:hypothetical protein